MIVIVTNCESGAGEECDHDFSDPRNYRELSIKDGSFERLCPKCGAGILTVLRQRELAHSDR